MTTSVSYAVATLRYYPDLVTQEFVNVGVALASHDAGWWGVKLAENMADLRSVFPAAQPRTLFSILRHMSSALGKYSGRLSLQFAHSDSEADPFAQIRAIVGETVGSLRWGPDYVQGISDDLQNELEYWFSVLVTVAKPLRMTAGTTASARAATVTHDAPSALMRQEFEKRGIWKRLGPVTVPAKIPIVLDHCFKNNRLHVFEPISLAHARIGNVVSSAERWRGHIDRLSDSSVGRVAFYGLVRLPNKGKRLEAAEAGMEIISGSRTADVRVFREDQVDELCAVAQSVVSHHDQSLGL